MMNTKLLALTGCLFVHSIISAQCNPMVFPSPGCTKITSNTSINDKMGGCYWVCSGLSVEVTYSAGSLFMLESNVQITFLDSEDDEVYAKPGCIINNASDATIGWIGDPSTVQTNNSGSGQVVMAAMCSPLVYDYTLVSGAGSCGSTTELAEIAESHSCFLMPNPLAEGQSLVITSVGDPIIEWAVFSLTGSLVYFRQGLHAERLTETLPLEAGYYLVRLKTEHAERIIKPVVVRQ